MHSSMRSVLFLPLLVGATVFFAGAPPASASFYDIYAEISLRSQGSVDYYALNASGEREKVATLNQLHLVEHPQAEGNVPGGGPYLIESFFDVFFDITISGGRYSGAETGFGVFSFPAGDPSPPTETDSFFDVFTEITDMRVWGPCGAGGAFMIRENGTLASTGETRITNIGGGSYRIDSFFDIFTELCLDGAGNSWLEASAPLRMSGSNIPEPSTLIVWSLLGAVGICARCCRRRRAA